MCTVSSRDQYQTRNSFHMNNNKIFLGSSFSWKRSDYEIMCAPHGVIFKTFDVYFSLKYLGKVTHVYEVMSGVWLQTRNLFHLIGN